MKKKNQNDFNAIHLFLGLLLGFFLGSTVVYWHFNRQNDRLFQEAMDNVLGLFSDQQSLDDANDLTVNNAQNQQNEVTGSQSPLNMSHTATSSSSVNPYLIAQDRLLHTQTITISNFNEAKSISRQNLEAAMGKTPSETRDQIFFVEFWESPLNTMGYKMSKNKIVLYGISSFESAIITHHEGVLYLQYLNEFFELKLTNTFQSLVPVSPPFAVDEVQPQRPY